MIYNIAGMQVNVCKYKLLHTCRRRKDALRQINWKIPANEKSYLFYTRNVYKQSVNGNFEQSALTFTFLSNFVAWLMTTKY